MHITDAAQPTNIDGLQHIPKKVIRDERGAVLHMLRSDNPWFDGTVGEIYFSKIKTSVIKGWKKHLEMKQRFAVPVGEIEFIFFDDRPDSPTRGQTHRQTISEQDYQLLVVPPQIWYAFKGLGADESLIVNCSDMPHKPQESVTMDFGQADFPIGFSS